jgi:uncharacterized protein
LNTVVIKSSNRSKISQAVEGLVSELRQNFPEIKRLIWFGSWVNGHPSRGSDVDLCLVVFHSDQPARDRASKYLPVGFPVGIDLVVYTEAEFDRLDQVSPRWKQEIMKGKELLLTL